MEEKESLKIEPLYTEDSPKPKLSNFSRRVFVFVKFILGICFLPLVCSTTVAFFNQFSLIDKTYQNFFWWGVVSFVIIYLFIWEAGIIYTRGQKLLEFIFNFFKPLVKIAPYLLPIYTILLFLIYLAFSRTLKERLDYFIFFFGFSLTLHLIFSAKTLRLKKEGFFKANYIFGFSLIYIINLFLFSLLLNLIFAQFSFVDFCQDAFQIAQGIFNAIFNQLFVNK